MASETVPAAANGPHDPATTPAQPTGLAGALARIEPARATTATFNLDPAAGDTSSTPTTSSTASSADFHDTTPAPGNTPSSSGSGKTPQPREGVFKTLVRAAAERWRKGADIHLKRLDMQKARHQAAQVKETRQVTVNNSPAPAPSRTQNSSGMGSGKGAQKANGGGSGNTPKNSSGTNRAGAGGRGADGAGSGTGRGRKDGNGAGKATPEDRNAKPRRGVDPKQPKSSPSPKPSPKPGGAPGAGSGSSGKAGPSGKDGKPGKDTAKKDVPKDASAGGGKGADRVRLTKDKPSRAGKDSTTTQDKTAKDKTTTGPKPGAAQSDKAKDKSGKTDTADQGGKATPATDSATKKTLTGVDLKKTKTTAGDTPATSSGKATTDTATPANTDADAGKHRPPRTQASREAGYRDGNRAARLVAHVEAYRDGTHDGWTDGRKDTAADKHRLDTARTTRQKNREDAVATPTLTGPQPIPVTSINTNHVTLPSGNVHTRGEIRTVKQYERNLTDKATTLQKATEATKALKQHAEEHAAHAVTLTEQARAVEGGDKLIAALNRLAEQATLQARIADDLHTRATRSADSTNALLANIATRYSAIYKAVCDSENTQPAKLFWYRDGAPTHA